MATTKEIDVNGKVVKVVEFSHSAQEIDDAVSAVQGGGAGGSSAAPLFIVTVTQDSETGKFTADKTFAAVQAAYNAGQLVVMRWNNTSYHLDIYSNLLCLFIRSSAAGDLTAIEQISASGFIMSSADAVVHLDEKYALLNTGGTMTGALTLSGAPTEDLHAATKKYVDEVAQKDSSLPEVSEADNDKILQVVNGSWAVVALADSAVTPHIGENGNWFIGDVDTGVAAQGPTGGTDEEATEQLNALVERVGTLEEQEVQTKETAELAYETSLKLGFRMNAFETPATSVDLSAYESEGKIVETYANGSTKTTVIEFDTDGNPVKVTNGDGKITTLVW